MSKGQQANKYQHLRVFWMCGSEQTRFVTTFNHICLYKFCAIGLCALHQHFILTCSGAMCNLHLHVIKMCNIFCCIYDVQLPALYIYTLQWYAIYQHITKLWCHLLLVCIMQHHIATFCFIECMSRATRVQSIKYYVHAMLFYEFVFYICVTSACQGVTDRN